MRKYVSRGGVSKELTPVIYRWDELDLPQVLQTILECGDDPQAAADLIVKRVLQRGAHDNVSVIVLKLDKRQPK